MMNATQRAESAMEAACRHGILSISGHRCVLCQEVPASKRHRHLPPPPYWCILSQTSGTRTHDLVGPDR